MSRSSEAPCGYSEATTHITPNLVGIRPLFSLIRFVVGPCCSGRWSLQQADFGSPNPARIGRYMTIFGFAASSSDFNTTYPGFRA